jgi:peroxiredoxin
MMFFVQTFAAFLLPLAVQAVESGKPAPDFKLAGADGKTYELKQFKGKTVVLEWFNHGCPFVKKFYDTKTMQDLQKKYTGKGVVWLSIVSSAPGKQGHETAENHRKIATEKGTQSTAILIDEKGEVGRLYGAKTTPHMFVVDSKGVLAYQGAMDDQPTPDTDELATAKNYVVAALDALLAKKPVEMASTKPYGCSVKYE